MSNAHVSNTQANPVNKCTSPCVKPSDMPKLVVAYHSAYGHSKRVAQAIVDGAAATVNAQLVDVLVLIDDAEHLHWQWLDAAAVLVFGCPTYMGSVTAEFKMFMDSTSKRWLNRSWQGKWAAGFANSGGLSGDKLAVLQQLCLFAMQHGMHWTGLPLIPTGYSEQDLNRLSGFLGLMTQSFNAPAEQTPPSGDINTAKWFGVHLAGLIT